MDGKNQAERKSNPREGANIFSVITFSWILKTLWRSYKTGLELGDITRPLKEHKGSILGDKLSIAWEKEKKRVNKINESLKKFGKSDGTKQRYSSLGRALLSVFGVHILISALILTMIETIIRVIQPLAIGRLLRYFSHDNHISKNEAYFYACVVILCSVIITFVLNFYFMSIYHVGMKMRVASCSLIYRKALKLSKASLAKTTVGQAVNLLSNDVSRFDLTPALVPYILIGPLQTIIITYIMYQEIGLPAVYGVIVLLILIPLQGWLGRKSSDFRLSTATKTDARIHSTNEVIRGIQAIKMYTWEYLFSDKIAEARKREINVIKYIGYIRGSLLSFMMFTTKICLLATIVPFVLSDETISTEKIFVLTAFYTALQQSMGIFFPYAISFFAELLVTIERLQEFMLLDEMESSIKYTSDDEEKSQQDEIITLQGKNLGDHSMAKIYSSYDDKKSLILENVYAKWLESDREDTLHGINIKIEPGQLVAIVGPVGSGKSSLVNVILKELTLSGGKISTPDKISYASQEPWLFSSSVVQNILFGRPMDQQKYNEIIDVCQLKRDFILLPYGDKTLVGERGAALSGGQRARINLARA
ncbi:hypothetical protein PV326_012047, partial [Microctonus aethiopoides]